MEDTQTFSEEKLMSMTVVQLKGMLAKKGLSTSGNKSELVAKLLSSQEDLEGSGISISDSILLEDEALLDDEDDIPPKKDESPLLSISNSTARNTSHSAMSEEELLGGDDFSPEKNGSKAIIHSKESALLDGQTSVAKPLKKRVIVQPPVEPVVVKKRLPIKRDNVPTPKIVFKSSPPPVDVKNNPNVKKIQPWKKLSELEKKEMRAKRFNITGPDPTSEENKVAKKAKLASSSVSAPNIAIPGTSLDVLKKRAARFGESVSTVIKNDVYRTGESERFSGIMREMSGSFISGIMREMSGRFVSGIMREISGNFFKRSVNQVGRRAKNFETKVKI